MKNPFLKKKIENYIKKRYNPFDRTGLPELSDFMGSLLEGVGGRKESITENKSLQDLLKKKGETFSQCLLRMIDASGRTDVDVYKASHIDKRLFSKIRSDKNYQPQKETVLAFCIGLRLCMDDAKDLLLRAGYAFSTGSKRDLIVQFFIEQKKYDLDAVNDALVEFGEKELTSF